MRATGIKRSDISDDSSKGFEVENEQYFIVKRDGNFFVYQNSCPHLGVNLEWNEDEFLESSKSMIQCSNHGALFVIESGLCVSGPCSGDKLAAVAFEWQGDELFIG